ncbi:MAG: UvrD-helicase domain-containing protein [Halofilum sp. (in: g-proteobacteria)]|nr:UvrD-helicase domain-containing protein [Halofilum sp. (in: g-proteobacteria)]
MGFPRPLQILSPAAEATRLAQIRNEYPKESRRTERQDREKKGRETAEQYRLAREHGLVCFDLFAPLVGILLADSGRIRRLVATHYPFMIFDEFQDTDAAQWNAVRLCGEFSTLTALADPEQRIFDFRGADPERIQHFCDEFKPDDYSLGSENYRSEGTEILAFGDAVVARRFRQESYSGINRVTYPGNRNQAFFAMKSNVLNAIRRLKRSKRQSWSVCVVVPTRQMTRRVSDYLESGGEGLPRIAHTATLDVEGIVLAGEIIAYMMEPCDPSGGQGELVDLVCNYYLGRGGGTPNATDIKEGTRLRSAYAKYQEAVEAGRTPSATSIAYKLFDVYRTVQDLRIFW